MRSLNPDQLRTFLSVVDLGSFSAAARRLNLTQPAVSLQIRELEGRLGVPLLDRMGRRAVPTPAGETLVGHARRIIAEIDAALEALRRHREGALGRVRLGSGASIAAYLLPRVLKALRDSRPDLEVVVRVGTADTIVRGLLAGEFDLAVLTLPVDERGLSVEPLRADPLIAVFPAGTALPDAVTPAEFARFPLILDERPTRQRALTLAWLQAGGITPRPVMELGSNDAVRAMVAAGMGASIMTPDTVADLGARVVARPLDPPVLRRIAIGQRHGQPDDPALRLLREALRTLAIP
ncbi:MAG TPA: LysR family transcriptional regulator [Azospirillum sp.]|nr:LysR family transcriptional regulator [Azospirillum sp.]